MTIDTITSNTAPEFSATSTTRVVLEGADKGTLIGNPVTATDGNSGERLTYWLSGTDVDRFSIDAMTGQLKVNTKLNYEGTTRTAEGIDRCEAEDTITCEVTVNAADSSAGSAAAPATITVNIGVIDVDEKPTFSVEPAIIDVVEGMTALWDATDSVTEAAATYTASDPEGGSVTLSLSGADASKFELNDPAEVVNPPDYSKVLAFQDKPDFEMPGDSNRDNIYQVTVVASDGVNSAMRDVIVKVTDMMEDGKIEVMPSQPRVGTALTATLTDSDGVMGPSWKWRRAMTENACPTIDADWVPDPDTTLIKDAESATYTPVVDDDGYCLRVEASYLDMDYTTMLFAKSVSVVVGKVQGSSANMAPVFADTRTMRYVPEDAESMVNVGAPVKAKDTDTLEYTLGGADKDLFTIVQDDSTTMEVDEGGQIRVEVGAMLDHETKPTLTVTVTANDPRGGTDTITVTINVTDVDEPPIATNFVVTASPYTENDTSPVLTLSASDPEGAAPIIWSILEVVPDPAPVVGGTDLVRADSADFASFDISQSGVLTFKEEPSFEAKSPSIYKVVVVASDGNEDSYFKVTVNVQDEEEEGSVELRPTGQTLPTLLQPQVGVGITAVSLTDPDGNGIATRNNNDIEENDASWQWYRSSSKTATGTAISSPSTSGSTGTEAAYTPVANDVGNHLRVVATYDDGRGSGKMAEAVSEHMTISAINPNTAPEFSATSTTRVVLEGADKGTLIGNPVTATDGNSGERLTYWLSGTDVDRFSIDAMTGQLKVNTKLNYEGTTRTAEGIDRCEAEDTITCEVTVNAADSSAGSAAAPATITVNIGVIDVDEKPTFSVEPAIIDVVEGMTALWDATDSVTEAAATYTASDPEGGSVTLSLSGADASKFELNDPAEVVNPPDYSKVLAFQDKPDFEMPGDSNRDNIYQVTVVASDGVNSAMRDVIVKVTDMMEDGKIEVMPSQPRVGTALTATLTDSDGVMGPSWKWRRAMTENACPTIDADWVPDPDTTLIKDAESATYTPVVDDDGYCLRVEASYLDMDYTTMLFAKSVSVVVGKVQGSSANMAPVFADTRTMRYVPEDAESMVNVGAPVKAKDTDTLEYTLGGADKDLFTIVQDDSTTMEVDEEGQIRVKPGAMLDHETKPTLTVTVTANDPRGGTDTITVTINVTDVDEMPVISQMNPDNRAPVFSSTTATRLSVAENTPSGRNIGAPVTATDPDNDSLTYTLSGTDGSAFNIGSTSGQLTTRAALDYETKNSYTVVVMARDPSGASDTITVTIDVTDVAEEVSSNRAPIFASLTANRSVDENTPSGRNIGAPVTATDPDNDSLTYALSGADGSAFNIDRTSGQMMTRAALDYETKSTYTVVVTATDPGNLTDTITVMIAVNDVAEEVSSDPLLAEYDPDDDGTIEKADMRRAVMDFFGSSPTLSRMDMRRLVSIYFSN